MKTYDVVIVNYNGAKIIEQCLASVYLSTVKPASVIIYDNDSQDESIKIIKKLKYNNLVLIEGKKNIGFGPGNNEALKISRSDFVLFVNNDILLDKNCSKSLLEAAGNKKIGVVNPLILRGWKKKKNQEIYSFGAAINRAGFAYSLIEKTPDSFSLSCFSGACFMARKKIIREIGFPKNFFLYYEEPAISIELLKRGYSIGRINKGLCYHLESFSSPQKKDLGIAFRQYYGIQNRWYIIGKHWPAKFILYSFLVNFLHLLFFVIFFVRIRQYQYLKLLFIAPAKFILGLFNRDRNNPKNILWYCSLRSDGIRNFRTQGKKVLAQ